MKSTLQIISVAVLVIGLAACGKEPNTTNADFEPPRSVPNDVTTKAPWESGTSKTDPKTSIREAIKVKRDASVSVPAGTTLRVALLDTVSSDRNQAGDQFLTTLAEPVVVDGRTVLLAGTEVRGEVVDARESGRSKGLASLELTLTQIIPADGNTINIST